MRAWQVQGAGEPIHVLHAIDVEVPEPSPGQLRIRVTAAGIGLPDVFMCRGTYPLTPPLPFTAGQEAAGVVTAVGDGVDVAVGSRIMCVTMFYTGHGSFAEECLVGPESAFAVPDGLTDAEAAGFWIPHLTGWIGLVDRGQARSSPVIGWWSSGPPAAAESPLCSLARHWARTSSPWSATRSEPRSVEHSVPMRRSITAQARSHRRSAPQLTRTEQI